MKRLIGQCLLKGCDRFPAAKPLVRKWGMRTSQTWFPDAVVGVQTLEGKSFKVASLPQNYLSFEIFWRGAGYYEPITTLLACELVRTTDVFIDAGANIGFFTLVLSSSRPGLRVIAFEPNPKNFQLLHANVHLNQFGNVTCEPLALSDMSGTAALYLSRSDMSASLESDFDNSRGAVIKVSTSTLDGYLAQRPVSGRLLIKVDVEGHEPAFFQGAQKTISNHKPDIITEITMRQDAIPLQFLKAIGYRFYQITDRGFLPTAQPAMVIRGRLRFLNCLLSARPEYEIADLFHRIEPRIRRIDLTQTSKFVEPKLVERFQKPAAQDSARAGAH